MLWLVIISVSLSFISSLLLLASPYLRITSLGWFIGIWWIPVFGALFFLLTMIRNQARGEDSHFYRLKEAHQHNEDCMDSLMNCLAVDHGFLPYFYLKDYRLYRDDEFIFELHSAIEKATRRIWITTYIFSGKVGDELIARLINAHERGVDVRLLVDRVGSGLLLPSKIIKEKFTSFPFNFSIFRVSVFKSLLFAEKRLHSKIVIIDEDLAFIGAHNLRDEALSQHKAFAKNVSLKFTGTVVKQLEAVFADLWLKNTKEALPATQAEESDVYVVHSHVHEGEVSSRQNDGLPARIIYSDPISRTHAYDQYLSILLMTAKTRIYVWMPYLIPTQTMRNTFIAKCKLGLDIKVLVPAKSDSAVVDNTHQLVLRELFDCGVSCAESIGDFDHSKILVVDDIVIIGSTNLDYRSLYRNYEANIEVNDKHFAEEIVREFVTEYDRARPIREMKARLVKTIVNQFTSLIAALY